MACVLCPGRDQYGFHVRHAEEAVCRRQQLLERGFALLAKHVGFLYTPFVSTAASRECVLRAGMGDRLDASGDADLDLVFTWSGYALGAFPRLRASHKPYSNHSRIRQASLTARWLRWPTVA